MSVQTQIDRLETAKSDIISAITGKGVSVPTGTKLDGMAALIESITSGGGNSGDTGSAMQVATGTFTGGASITSVTISGLVFTPKSLVVCISNPGTSTYYFVKNKNGLLSLSAGELFEYNATSFYLTTSMSSFKKASEYYSVQFTEDGFVISSLDASYYVNGAHYTYYAFG